MYAGLALVSLLAGARAARAEQGSNAGADIGVPVSPVCPARDEILTALRKLGTREDPDRVKDAALRAGLATEDLGPHFRVTVGGRTRQYEDVERDCSRRARLAAVFCALVLAPDGPVPDAPETSEASQPAAAEVVPQPPRALRQVLVVAPPLPTASPRRVARWVLGAGPSVALAPHRGSALVAGGVALAASGSFGHTSIGGTLDVPLLPATLTAGGVVVGLRRIPLRVLIGRAAQWGQVSGGVEAGLVAAVLRVERTGPPPLASTTRLEWGGHVGLGTALWLGRWGLYLAMSSDWIPRTYPIALDPEGAIDRTPGVWLTGEAGLRLSFD